MKNPVFKEMVKRAFGADPLDTARNVAGKTRDQILRGLSLEEAVGDTAHAAGRALSGAGNLASRVMEGRPASLLTKGLGKATSFVAAHPAGALTTAALASILPKAFEASQHRHQDELMNAYHNPMTVVAMDLDEFLEKKAASFAPEHGFSGDLRKGIASALGGTLVNFLAQQIGTHFADTKNVLVSEPRRRQLLETLFKSDPVIKDSIERHPDSKAMVLEAYGTMVRFAPHLSLDINAVRSFLREAVLGGAGVNYATIKNLVDTERSIADSKPRYGGK